MTILSTAVEANGWVLAVTGSWGPTPGAWEHGGLDRVDGRFLAGGVDQFPLDPDGTPKVVLVVETGGHDRVDGLPLWNPARRRELVAVKALRRPHPAHAQLDETDHGDGTRTIRLALSDRVLAGAVVTRARFLPGWKAGHGGGALTAVGNASARQPVPPISRWAVPPYLLVEGTAAAPNTRAQVDVLIASHYPEHGPDGSLHQACAALRLVATDGTVTKTFWFTGPRTSPVHGDNLRCWGGEIDLAGLSPGLVTVHRTVFPWTGAARSTGEGHSTSINGAGGAAHDVPLHICYDPLGSRYAAQRRFVFVDATSPLTAATQSASVVLHMSLEAARAAPLETKPVNVSVALQAMRAAGGPNGVTLPPANGLAGGTRSADFWEIVLTDGQVHSMGPGVTGSGTTINGREGLVVLRGDPAAADPRASCILRTGTSAPSVQCNRWWMRDLRLELGQAALMGGSGSVLVLERCHITGKAGFAAGTNGIWATSGASTYIVESSSGGYQGQPGGSLVRNMVRTTGVGGQTLVGVTIAREAGLSGRGGGDAFFLQGAGDFLIWNCRAMEWAGGLFSPQPQNSVPGTAGVFGNPRTLTRVACVNTLMEGIPGEAAQQFGEGSYVTLTDSLFEGCSLFGSRYNWHNQPDEPFVASGTTVTAGLMAHGLAVGDTVVVSGCLPAAFNGTFVVASVPDANRFTYVAAGAPGVMTQKGEVLLPGGAVRPIVKFSLAHSGITVRNTAMDRNATKQDIWSADGVLTGCFETLYGVGYEGSLHGNRGVNSPADWQYAWRGLRGEVDTSYSSQGTDWWGIVRDGTGLSGAPAEWDGDYRPLPGSRLLERGRVAVIDHDLEGVARGPRFAAGAFNLEMVAGDAGLAPASAVLGHWAAAGRLGWAGELAVAGAAHGQWAAAGALAAVPPVAPPATGGMRRLKVAAEGRTVRVSPE